MNMKSQALDLQNYLSQYTKMWKDEIMNEYPESITHYPCTWVDLLDSLTEAELYEIDCKRPVEKIKNSSFEHFLKQLSELSKLPVIAEVPEIPLEDWAFQGIKKKKRHEIQKIVPVLKNIKELSNFEYVVDIGGGVGHLSRVLSHYHSIPSISLDRDPNFQKIGFERLSKYRKIEGARDVSFVNITFGKVADEEILKTIFKPQAFSLGLHTCGVLAVTVIQKSIDYKTTGLLSFGCCYHQLKPDIDFPLSNFYKENQYLKLNLYALTLATRSHAEMSFSDYQTKERVKSYRYALHLFLIQYFDNKSFTGVGECHIRTYWGPFATYIKSKLAELNLTHSFTDEDFNQFYAELKIQKELRKMWLCNIIRWQLGRALEVYLLLDRCLYLEEQGFRVQIEQYFQETLSPRNIGILAISKNK
jgi:hypothetical protein